MGTLPVSNGYGRMSSEWIFATVALVVSIGLFIFSAWWGSRPPQIGRTRMIPWNIVQLAATMGIILTLVHMLNLLGFHTGRK